MQRRGSIVIILVVILAIIGIGAAYYLGTQKTKSLNPVPNEIDNPESKSGKPCTMEAKLCPDGSAVGRSGPDCEFAPCPETLNSNNPDWKTYSNSTIGFEIMYPPEYQALTDADNLYGWKNAVVLFYKGGQSYDLVVQVWNSESEYKSEYPDTSKLSVYTVGNKFVTLLNNNSDDEVQEIISTFKVTQ